MNIHDSDSPATPHSPRSSWSPPQVSSFDENAVLSPAGWLDDPTGAFKYRYWDGRNWTAHVSDGGTSQTDDYRVAVPESTDVNVGTVAGFTCLGTLLLIGIFALTFGSGWALLLFVLLPLSVINNLGSVGIGVVLLVLTGCWLLVRMLKRARRNSNFR